MRRRSFVRAVIVVLWPEVEKAGLHYFICSHGSEVSRTQSSAFEKRAGDRNACDVFEEI
jgi:hypothetical protein